MTRRRTRRFLRLTLRAGVAVLVLGAVLLLAAVPIAERLLLPRALAKLSDALGLEAAAEGLSLSLGGAVELRDLRVRGPAPSTGVRALSIERASAALSPLGLLLGREGWLERVRLDGPRLELDLGREPLLPELEGLGGPGERGAAAGSPRLPAVEVAGGEVRLVLGPETLDLHGLSLSFDGRRARLRLERAEGDWRPPRVEALDFPIEVEAVLEGGPEPWRRVRVERAALGGREVARDLVADATEAGAVKLSGDLPGWGAALASGSVAGGMLELSFRAERADLQRIASAFTAWRAPRALATGDLRLVVPLGDEGRWSVAASVLLEGVAWEEEGLGADLVDVRLRRGGEGLVLAGDVLAVGLRWGSLPDMDLHGTFRRQAGAGGGARIVLEDVAVHRGGAAADLACTLREGDGLLEDGALRLAAAVEDLAALLPELGGIRGALEIKAAFEGSPAEPASLAAAGRLEAAGLEAAPGAPPVDLRAEARLGGCQLELRGALEAAGAFEARAGFAVTAGTHVPARVAFERLEGVAAGIAFAADEPPVLDLDGHGCRIEPSTLHLLGGEVRVAGLLEPGGGSHLELGAQDLDFSGIPRDLTGGLALEGTASVEARVLTGGLEGPEARLEVRVEGLVVQEDDLRVEGLALRGAARAGAESLELEDLVVERSGDRLRLSARAPIAWGPGLAFAPGGSVEASFQLDLADAGTLPFRLEGVRELRGRVVAAGSASVPVPDVAAWLDGDPRPARESLRLTGSAAVIDGSFVRRDDFPPVTGIEGELRVEGSEVRLTTFEGTVHDSRFRASGRLSIAAPWEPGGPGIRDVDLALAAEDALLVRSPDLRVRGDLDLRWTGPWQGSLLAGDVRIARAYFLEDIPLQPPPIGAASRPRRPLRLFAFKDPPLGPMTFRVRVTSDRGITLRNNLVSTRASADLLLGGTGAEPSLAGALSTDEGTVRLAGSSLRLRSSLVELLERDPMNPRLQIVLGETIRGYAVTVDITGSLEEPEVLLDATPPLEREKVLVLITTGLTLDEIEERGVSRVAAVKAAQYLGFRVARYLARGDPTEPSFFDRFSLETESARRARLDDPVRVEYRIAQKLLLERDELFLQGERDAYGDYNFSVGLRLELD